MQALDNRPIDAAGVERQRCLDHLIDVEDDLGLWDVSEKPAHHRRQNLARECGAGLAKKAPALTDVPQFVDQRSHGWQTCRCA
jgi:hypothetical protein